MVVQVVNWCWHITKQFITQLRMQNNMMELHFFFQLVSHPLDLSSVYIAGNVVQSLIGPYIN